MHHFRNSKQLRLTKQFSVPSWERIHLKPPCPMCFQSTIDLATPLQSQDPLDTQRLSKGLAQHCSESNKSHPAMEKAVQHEDSMLINAGEWRAIKVDARVIASRDLLPLPIPCNTPILMKKKTKTYFTRYYLKQWNNTVLKLEEQEPLLALCAAHWKAEHVLNTILTGTSESNQKASTRRDDASNLEDPAVPLPASPSKMNTSSSKCCLSNPSLSKPKRRRQGKRRVPRIA